MKNSLNIHAYLNVMTSTGIFMAIGGMVVAVVASGAECAISYFALKKGGNSND